MPPGSVGRSLYDLLYVEDRAYDLEVVRAVLKDRNHRIRFNSLQSPEEGREYIDRRDRYADAPLADLVLVDVRDYDCSGLDFIEYLRKNRVWKLIPVVAFVADETQANACYDLYVNACVPKPAGLDQLASVVIAVHDFWFRHVALLPSEARLVALTDEFDRERNKRQP
jgi:CheY-like chemotaxis protein